MGGVAHKAIGQLRYQDITRYRLSRYPHASPVVGYGQTVFG
jgi:hypothetical protein